MCVHVKLTESLIKNILSLELSIHPKSLVNISLSQQQVEGGASTATVAIVDKETGILEVAALGDSALGVVRDFRFVAATDNTTQLRSYNCPNQFAIIPESYDHRGPTWVIQFIRSRIHLCFTVVLITCQYQTRE